MTPGVNEVKVLWYVNIVMPEAAGALGLPVTNTGGWLDGLVKSLAGMDVQLVVTAVSHLVKEKRVSIVDDVQYIVLPVTAEIVPVFERLVAETAPDIVHVHGTEYKYNTDIIEYCCAKGIRCVVSVQGLMEECAKHYCDGLPEKLKKVNPVVQLMKKVYTADSIALEQRAFYEQGIREHRALQTVKNVIGRTHWDKACVTANNPGARYFHVNENLRSVFYEGEGWSVDACEEHSIFMSQASYPIKGLHQVLPALAVLAQRYPDVKLYIGGAAPYTLGNRLLDTFVDYFFEYQGYIKKLIRKYDLQDRIVYTGLLSASQMKKRFLASHVFLSASTIENSPNSVGEAMLLGVPVVASDVGGTATMLEEGVDGWLYNFYDTDTLVSLVSRIFDDRDHAEKLSANARKHAAQTHDRTVNADRMKKVYQTLLEE